MSTELQTTQVHQMTLTPGDVVHQVTLIQKVMQDVMRSGSHYGTIPGCGDKPALFKPGAEKLCMTFRLAPTYDIQITEMERGHREYVVTCELRHIVTNELWGSGVGSCSTMESKYRWRKGDGEPTGESVPHGYWDERKRDPRAAQKMIGGPGFSAKKIDSVWMIVKTGTDRVENTDPADVYNTCLKMGKKRAHVDAVLTVTAASDIFTQDIEDLPPDVIPPPAPAVVVSTQAPMPPEPEHYEVQVQPAGMPDEYIDLCQEIYNTVKPGSFADIQAVYDYCLQQADSLNRKMSKAYLADCLKRAKDAAEAQPV